MKSVLFVCTANMCRSPVAEGLMKQLVDQRGEADQWRVDSAGASALEGQLVTPESVQVAAELGADIRGHRSRPVTGDLLEQYSLVLVMERRHQEALRAAFPERADRIYLLSEMVGESSDVWDPVGTGIENYRAMGQQVHTTLENGYERIRALAG